MTRPSINDFLQDQSVFVMSGSLPHVFIGIWLQQLYPTAIILVKDTNDLFISGHFSFLTYYDFSVTRDSLLLEILSCIGFHTTLTLPLQLVLLCISVIGSPLHQPSRHDSAVFRHRAFSLYIFIRTECLYPLSFLWLLFCSESSSFLLLHLQLYTRCLCLSSPNKCHIWHIQNCIFPLRLSLLPLSIKSLTIPVSYSS